MQDAIGFSEARFSALSEFSKDHFWFAGRQRLATQHLRKAVQTPADLLIDIGCGPGTWLETWRAYAHEVCGIEPHAANLEAASFAPGIRIVPGVADALPFENGTVDLAIAMDVLEHVDDAKALAEVVRVLKPGGLLLASVPAYPWLWSFRDEDAGHLRRYTKKTVDLLLDDAGLRLRQLQFYQSLLFPLVVVSRIFGRRSATMRDREDNPPKCVNTILRRINLFEVNSGLRLKFGSSILILAEKSR